MVAGLIFIIALILYGIHSVNHVFVVRKRGWNVRFGRHTFGVSVIEGKNATRYDWIEIFFGIFLIVLGLFLLVVYVVDILSKMP